MFNLEQSIAQWRQQMLSAGIQTPATLEELELHLREEIGRQVKSGLNQQRAFEISVSQIGQPAILAGEFQKTEGRLLKKIGIFAAIVGGVIISRILTEHPDAGHLRAKEQTAWLIIGGIICFFGLAAALFVKIGDRGTVRLWKLVGVSYSIFAAAFSIFLTTFCLAHPRINSAFTITDWILVLAANTASIFSVVGWQHVHKLLPVIHNSQIRGTIGIAFSLLGALWMVAYIVFIVPHQLQGWLSHFMVMFLWAWAVMSLLGGVGYGLENAARKSTAT